MYQIKIDETSTAYEYQSSIQTMQSKGFRILADLNASYFKQNWHLAVIPGLLGGSWYKN